ncbi:MAG: hypothetical protein AVDCRST_MAG33-888, partial [uncultured Thermomicrobiales bacterium]
WHGNGWRTPGALVLRRSLRRVILPGNPPGPRGLVTTRRAGSPGSSHHG